MRVPFGPFTVTVLFSPPTMVTSTPPGTVMGDLPMRDMRYSDSPHVAEDFAADFALARFAVGHQPLAGGQDSHTETAEDAGTASPLR